jgi:hypothetical protein
MVYKYVYPVVLGRPDKGRLVMIFTPAVLLNQGY